MDTLRAVLSGIAVYKDAWHFLVRHRLWAFVIIPALFNLLLFGGWMWGAWSLAADWGLRAEETARQLPYTWLKDFYDWIEWLVRIMVFAMAFLVYGLTYKILILTILSPFHALLAEKVQEKLSGKTSPPFSPAQLWHDIWRGVRIALGNSIREWLITIPLGLLGLIIPFISPLTTAVIILTQAYFYGFSMIDYHHECLRISAQDSRHWIWQHRATTAGIGLGFYLLMLIPVLGVLLAPSAAVIAAGLAKAAADRQA